jgi:hypothetical protein
MTWYIEWPHIDGAFVDVYASLAGIRGMNRDDSPDDN